MKLRLRFTAFIFVFFSITLFLFAQDSNEEKKEKPPINEKKVTAEIKALMDQFSRKNKIDILEAVRKRTVALDRQEYKLKTEQEMFEKALGKIGEIVTKTNDSDSKKFVRLDTMLQDFKKEIKEFDKKLTAEEETKLTKLIATFKEIKAKKAALIVPEMDMELVVKVLLALPARSAGAIMQNLAPKLAAQISHRMAEERKKQLLKEKGDKLIDENAPKEKTPQGEGTSSEKPKTDDGKKGTPKKIKKGDKGKVAEKGEAV